MKNYRFHKVVYKIAHTFCGPFLKKYSFETDQAPKVDGPCIIMANHTTERDMLMLMRAFGQHMYFVCGEHLLRTTFGKIVMPLFAPIPEFKGAVATRTVREIVKRAKEGAHIMIFPEGSRSFNGETIPVTVAAGKLVKMSKSALVTYRITGGYFVAPRWAYTFRKGKVDGKVIRVYSAEEIAKMTPEEITDCINRDLYENAYETQRKRMDAFVCESKEDKQAEGLENFLIICPECKGYDTLASNGNTFCCTKCDMKGTMDEYGFMHGDKVRFESVYDWGKWIEGQFDEDMKDKDNEELLFTETEVCLYKITTDHERVDLDAGDMKVYKDRLELCGHVFPFQDMPAMSMLYYGKTLLFTYEGVFYGITGEHYHAWKCNRLFELVKA